jgi:cytoskeletal protein RodZ
VSIGDALAQARRQAGLTLTQVSQRTCIRETIIRGIERGDYSACGGDFYARGHIRSIARAVGADPEPLIREYDATQGAPQAITAAEAFQTSTPIKLKERRRPNWSAAMALALALIVGLVVWRVVDSRDTSKVVPVSSGTPSGQHTPAPHAKSHTSPTTSSVAHSRAHSRKVVIELTASQTCWVQLTTASGQPIFTQTVQPGAVERWTERHPVQLVLGNPAGVTVTVNGKNALPANSTGQVLTLSLGRGLKISG